MKISQEPISQAGHFDEDPLIPVLSTHLTPLDMVREFAKQMEQPLDEKWFFSHALERQRWQMISEEYGEAFDESAAGNNPAAMLKEIADRVYVLYGYCGTYGWNLDKAIWRVHLSNMSKIGVDGKPLKHPSGKVMKGPHYQKPDLTDLVETK